MTSQTTASLPTTLRSPPSLDAYTLLNDHESRTPASFFEGPPVLHYYKSGARAYLGRENQDKLPWGASTSPAPTADGEVWPVMGDDMVEQVVDVFVGSDTLILYSPSSNSGVALPYPVVSLHAIKSAYTADNRRVPTIYMQLELSGSGGDNDEEPETVELTVVPAGTIAEVDAPVAAGARPSQTTSEASKLFDAISACADLHPDRFGEDDSDGDGDGYPSFFREGGENGSGDYGEDDGEYYEEDGEEYDGILVEGSDGATMQPIEGFRGVFRGSNDAALTAGATPASDLPPPMPGSGGWITAENAHEFFDEEGNWIGRGGSLGEGAGRVRGRDEVEATDVATAEAIEADAAVFSGASSGEPVASATNTETNGHNEASNGDGTESKRLRTE